MLAASTSEAAGERIPEAGVPAAPTADVRPADRRAPSSGVFSTATIAPGVTPAAGVAPAFGVLPGVVPIDDRATPASSAPAWL